MQEKDKHETEITNLQNIIVKKEDENKIINERLESTR